MKFSVSEATDLIRSRRTIYPKDYTDRVVHREMVERVLTNATFAPTHGMTQPWRFTVYSGSARERLARFLGELYTNTTPTEKFLQRKHDNITQRPLQSSVVIGIGMEHDPAGKISLEDDLLAMACAVQNMQLTCTAYGLGSFWATSKVVTGDAMRDHLGLGTHGRALGLLFMGYPSIEWPKGYRKPIDQLVTWVES
ncbi:MAG: nitroreductase [Flavobacteriales bacterium]|nr:nitroreductase [Flavobacteriales bacterium]